MLENFKGVRLNHGLMECGYINHQASRLSPVSSSSGDASLGENLLSISFTATTDHMGNFVLGEIINLFHTPLPLFNYGHA